MSNQRRRSRACARFRAAVVVDGRDVPIVTENISLKGLLCTGSTELPDMLSAGQECLVKLDLSPEATISIQGRIIRSTPTETAIDFLRMDEDSFAHLRNLVRFNIDNPDVVDEEIAVPAFDPLGK
jgi:hypothetical protein